MLRHTAVTQFTTVVSQSLTQRHNAIELQSLHTLHSVHSWRLFMPFSTSVAGTPTQNPNADNERKHVQVSTTLRQQGRLAHHIHSPSAHV